MLSWSIDTVRASAIRRELPNLDFLGSRGHSVEMLRSVTILVPLSLRSRKGKKRFFIADFPFPLFYFFIYLFYLFIYFIFYQQWLSNYCGRFYPNQVFQEPLMLK
jgi:hypothetical protein